MAVDKDLLVVMNTIDDTKNHMSEGQYIKTCDSIKRIHRKLSRPSLPIPDEFQVPLTKKLVYIFTVAVSTMKVIESIKRKFTSS
jgi:hypothetical protein